MMVQDLTRTANNLTSDPAVAYSVQHALSFGHGTERNTDEPRGGRLQRKRFLTECQSQFKLKIGE